MPDDSPGLAPDRLVERHSERYRTAAQALAPLLAGGRGALIGDTTCASRSVHTLDPLRPGCVRVVSSADAGRVFYHRRQKSQVVHMDVFHAVGVVNHRAVATVLRQAALRYVMHRGSQGVFWVPPGAMLPDLIDVQTASGGGRVSGALTYGQGPALKESHQNHVHIACLLPDEGLDLLFWLVAATEREILRHGLEIRRLDGIEHDPGTDGSPLDLSPYASASDSLLRGDLQPSGPGQATPLPANAIDPAMAKLALDLAGEFGTMEDLSRAIRSAASGTPAGDWPSRGVAQWSTDTATSVLQKHGLLLERCGSASLTDDGWRLYFALQSSRRELEAQFKRMLRHNRSRGVRPKPNATSRPNATGRLTQSRTAKEACPVSEGERFPELAVVPTVISAAVRAIAGNPAAAAWAIAPSDFRTPRPRPKRRADVCLVLDASASMAGRRLRAAKYLAQHLLLASRDRVAVVVFQERQARVVVPFTRDFRAAERGLASIEPLGLTPLAEGLMTACDYVQRRRRNDCCLLLITDGIPTVPKWGQHPMDDARQAATELSRHRLRLVCLGLEPNRGFLTELAAVARGSLYVVEELEPDSLVKAINDQGLLNAGRGK